MRDRDRGARRKVLAEDFAADCGHARMVARVGDEHRHGDDVRKLAAGLFQRLADGLEHPAHLRIEVPGERLARGIGRAGVAGNPDRLAGTFGRDRERVARLFRPLALDEGLAQRLRLRLRGGADGGDAAQKTEFAKNVASCPGRHCYLPWLTGFLPRWLTSFPAALR